MKTLHLTYISAALLFTASTTTASARKVSSEEALARIVTLWNGSGAHRASAIAPETFTLASSPSTLQPFDPSTQLRVNAAQDNLSSGQATEGPTYYIFDRTGGGFVVAPADDAQPAVLAVIDEGHYDADRMPDGFKAWLQEISTYGAACSTPKKAGASAAPLLDADQIAWGQEAPYNNDCPKFNYYGYNYPTLAGCAAIAAGQIMRYHKHPAQGRGSVSYSSYVGVQGGATIETAVDRTMGSYDWSKILGNYTYTSYTKDQAAEVAKLVSDVACASRMNFDPTASATTDLCVAKALKSHFDYDAGLQLVDHSYYSTAEWAELLRREIDARRPVYLSGANVTNTPDGDLLAGHAFVCDGYSADGLFHINWGWNGSANGYYALTDLTPRQQGAGGSTGGYAFMANAIIGIQPNEGGSEASAFLTLSGEYWELRYDAENDGYVIYVNIANPTATDFEGFVALRVVEDGEVILAPKQLAWRLGCKAGVGGTLGKGIKKDYFIAHPTARIELVYAHKAGVNSASESELTALLESIGDEEWLPIAAREGAAKSLVVHEDAAGGGVDLVPDPAESFQLRLAGLTSDITPQAGSTVKFTATVTNQSDYEYFSPLYLFVYNRSGELIDYSPYALHLLPAHATKRFDFDITLPSGAYSYAVAYEDKGYDWGYVPMPLYQGSAYSTGGFEPLLEPTVEEGGSTPGSGGEEGGEDGRGQGGYVPAVGAVAYYVRNIESGCYLTVVESPNKCARLAEEKEVLYFEPTGEADSYIIKGHTGLYLGGSEVNTWHMGSGCPETWVLEEIADGQFAFHAKSNIGSTNGYIGFDDVDANVSPSRYFDTEPAGFAAFRNKRYTAHGLFALEPAEADAPSEGGSGDEDKPAYEDLVKMLAELQAKYDALADDHEVLEKDYEASLSTIEEQQATIEAMNRRIESFKHHVCGDSDGDGVISASDIAKIVERALGR